MSDSVRPHPWDSPGKNTGVGCHFLLQCMKVKSESEVSQSCPTLHNPRDCSPRGSSVHGIFQARVLEWGAIAFSSYMPYLSTKPSMNTHPSSPQKTYSYSQRKGRYMKLMVIKEKIGRRIDKRKEIINTENVKGVKKTLGPTPII